MYFAVAIALDERVQTQFRIRHQRIASGYVRLEELGRGSLLRSQDQEERQERRGGDKALLSPPLLCILLI